MSRIKWVLETSPAKTLASKFRISVQTVFDGFPPRAVTGNDLGSDWDREIAIAGCRFALAQASRIRLRPVLSITDSS